MSRSSQAEALREMRDLIDTNAGRVQGQSLRYRSHAPIPAGSLTPEAAALLHDSIYRERGTPVTGDTIYYVVSCDGTPIVWLTYGARVVTPAATLTSYQLRHQAQAVVALSHLSRGALKCLAHLRDASNGRSPGPEPYRSDSGTQVLVADPADPTLTHWTRITADPAESLRHLRQVCDTTGPVLIVDAFGYGDYGRLRDRLDVEVLCVIEDLATTHDLLPAVVGDWLHVEGATKTDLTADQITAAFATAYVGVHSGRHDFATVERDRRGWTGALRAAGIPDRFFHTEAFVEGLFRDSVRDVRVPGGGIAVFRRT
ncbi:hypothetical protein ACI2K4_22230 [Micromonospora sp. NPDC050397]|uniref:hypothetical protein n=1 Tax=Micromonospora sp. NPDC050397 TaxID=3364279 RepID=UPI00384BAE32